MSIGLGTDGKSLKVAANPSHSGIGTGSGTIKSILVVKLILQVLFIT